MKTTDSQGRNLLTTGKIALAGTLLLAGPALANDDRTSFRDFRDANPGLDRQELRQMFRAERRDHVQQLRDARITTGGGGPRVEYTPVIDSKFVIQPIVTPTTPRLEQQTTFVTDKGRTRNVSKGLKLDLTSDNRSIVLGDNLFSNASSYTVNVGGEQKVLTSGSKVTAAEFVALQQVIDGDAQSLVVDGAGRGVDGSFNLGSIDNAGRSIKASSLTISAGVDAVGNFGRNGDFKVTRELVNYGSMYALTSNAANSKANIGARDVTNAGTITTQAPEAVAAANGAVNAPIDLKVSADRDLNNLGSIASNGTVTLSAGGTLSNSGSVSAQSDVALLSSNVVNSGSIASTAGNVNFDTASPASIAVNNAGGTISALNGAINFRSAGFVDKVDTTVSGGDWYSQTLNLNGGDGHVDVNVGAATGVINTYAGTAAVRGTSTLNVGETVTSGDPLFESGADLNVIASQTTGGGPLTYVATGNINIASGLTFNTSNTGDGGDILFIAGAAHTGTGPLTITGASASGGSITYTGTAPVFNASSSAANGGDVTFAAFSGVGGGVINLGGSTITSTGANTFSNGTVSMFANSITAGDINVNGAGTNNTAGTGNILLAGGQPQIVGTLTIDAAGAVTSGSLAPGSTTGSTVTSAGTLNARNAITVSADSTNVQNANVSAGSYSVTSGGTIQILNGINVTGSLTLLTTQNIDIRNSIIAPGGILMVAGEDISVITPPVGMTISTSAAGQGGNITMVSGAAFTQTATTVTITGAANATDGASINLTFGTTLVDTRGTGLNASGGNITLVAYASTGNAGSGSVNTDSGGTIRTGGTGTGNNGDFVIVSGRNDNGQGIALAGGVNTSGAANNGSGDVTLRTSTPVNGVIVSKVNGGISSGTFLGGATVNSGISSGSSSSIITNGGDVNVISGRINSNLAIDLGTITAQTGAVRINASGTAADIQLRTIQGGSIVVTATQDVNMRGGLGWNTTASGGGGILVVAGRDIINIDSGTDLNTNPGALTQAGSISLIAGANYTETATDLTITGPTTTGGNINLGNGFDQLDSQGIGDASGGQINLIAYRETATGTRGTVFVDTSADVVSQGAGAGRNNGEIIVMAGNNQGGSGINIGGIWDTNGTTSGTGNVFLLSAQPINGAVLNKTSAAYTSVGFTNGAVPANNNINGTNSNFTMDVDRNATLTMRSGNTLNLTNTTVNAGRIRISAEGVTDLGTLNTFGNGTVVVTSTDSINIRSSITAPGGIVMVAGGGILNINSGDLLNTSRASGNGGDVVMVAGATFTQDLVNVTITGSSNLSTSINLGNTFAGIDTRSLGGNGTGGDITLVRMTSTDNFSNSIFVGGTATLQTGGNGTGANGNITVISGQGGNGTGIQMDADIGVTGGTAGTGDVTMLTAAPANGVIQKSDAVISTTFGGGAATDSQIFQSNGEGGIVMAGGTLTASAGRVLQLQGVTNPNGAVVLNAGLTNSSSTANIKAITAGSVSITSLGGVTVLENITATGDIDISTTQLIAQANLTANSIDVSSPIGAGGLLVNGNTANAVFNATGPGLLVRFTANDGDLSLSGNQTYTSNAELKVVSPTGALNVLGSADIEGLQTLRAIASTYNFTGSIVGNPLILTATGIGTIANSTGDVTLSGNVVLTGSFAIIALGNVNMGTATQIDLSGSTVGGSLTVLAGFNFTPATAGQVGPTGNETVTYTGITPSSIGGNINFSGVTISTNGGTGNGGEVTLIASDGTLSAGNISVGNIDASGTTAGGNVRIIGPGNITTGQILATGSNGGDILVSTTAPVVTGAPSILNGVISGGGFNTGGASLDKKSGSLVINGSVDSTGVGGSVTLVSNSTKNFVIGGTKKVKNGVLGGVIAGTGNSLTITNARGGVQVDAGNPVTASTVTLNAGGKGALVTGKGAVLNAATSLTLNAETGNIGKKVFAFNSARVNADTDGSISLQSLGAAPLLVDDSEVGGSFTLTTAGGVTLNDIVNTKGSISVTAATGGLTINDGSVLTANSGALTLINSDINNGNINLGANTVIETQVKGKDVNIAIGAPPKKPTNTTPPAGVTVNNTGKGQSFFSAAGGFTVVGANETRGTNKNVIINNGSATPSTQKIIFGGNVVVEADPPSRSAAAVMPAMMVQTAQESAPSAGLFSLNPGTVSAASTIGSGFNAQNISAIPTDLLSTMSGAANAEVTVAGLSAAVQPATTVSTAYDYITEAYVWSDEDLGLGTSTMLKSGTATAGTVGGTAVVGGAGGAAGVSTTEVAKLRQGTIVLAPSKNTRIETPMGTIEVSKGSVALVVLDGTRLGVYDLHDDHKGSIRVSTGAKSTILSPGRCTVLTTKVQHGFERVNPMESVGYKSVAAVNHGNGVKAFNAEFATMHAIGSVKPLMEIVNSKHDNARRMRNKLMKTSAVLMHIGGGGEFKVYAEPSVTAMNR